jgi:hypothetical protein
MEADMSKQWSNPDVAGGESPRASAWERWGENAALVAVCLVVLLLAGWIKSCQLELRDKRTREIVRQELELHERRTQ